MSRAAALLATASNPLRVVDSCDFSGSPVCNTTRGAKLTGIADSKQGIISMWFRVDGLDGIDRVFFALNSVTSFRLFHSFDNKFFVSGGGLLGYGNATAVVAGAAWRHLLWSWDLAVAGSGRVFLDDVSDKGAENTFTNSPLLYSGDTNAGLAANTTGTEAWSGCIAEFFFDTRFLDLSMVANRRKFRSANGRPVHLGSNGSLPFGVAPFVYFHLDDGEAVANFNTNRGVGGSFTTANGTPATGSTSPSD